MARRLADLMHVMRGGMGAVIGYALASESQVRQMSDLDKLQGDLANELISEAGEVARIGDQITTATNTASALPMSHKEYLKRLSMLVLKCEQAIEDHASGVLPLSSETLSQVAHTLRSVHQGMDSLILDSAIWPQRR